jgi:hypothetical protein
LVRTTTFQTTDALLIAHLHTGDSRPHPLGTLDPTHTKMNDSA